MFGREKLTQLQILQKKYPKATIILPEKRALPKLFSSKRLPSLSDRQAAIRQRSLLVGAGISCLLLTTGNLPGAAFSAATTIESYRRQRQLSQHPRPDSLKTALSHTPWALIQAAAGNPLGALQEMHTLVGTYQVNRLGQRAQILLTAPSGLSTNRFSIFRRR